MADDHVLSFADLARCALKGPRASLVLKADLRQGVTDGLTSKVETIERYLEP